MSPSAKFGKTHPLIAISALALHAVGVWFTWRDLREKSDSDVRGGKNVWRIASALNLSGSVAYWIFGRRPAG